MPKDLDDTSRSGSSETAGDTVLTMVMRAYGQALAAQQAQPADTGTTVASGFTFDVSPTRRHELDSERAAAHSRLFEDG